MLTAAIYTSMVMLFVAGIRRVGVRPVLIILALSMASSAAVGATFDGPARIVGFILCDTFTIFAVAAWRDRDRDRVIGLVSWACIWWSLGYNNQYMDYAIYAAGLNCAAALQLLIGGGMLDDVGRHIDDWLDSRWPRGARALRYVVV